MGSCLPQPAFSGVFGTPHLASPQNKIWGEEKRRPARRRGSRPVPKANPDTPSLHPLPSRSVSIGDAITHVREQMETEDGMGLKYTFSGAQYFKRMQELKLYTLDIPAIKERVEKAGMTNLFAQEVK